VISTYTAPVGLRRHLAGGVARAAAIGLSGLLAACGGGDEKSTSVGSSGTISPSTVAASTTTASTAAPVTTSGGSATTSGRTPVPTTLPPLSGATAIDRTFIPEATASYEFRQLTMNGVTYNSGLRISSSRTPVKVEINAGRGRKRFLAVLGIPDDQRSSSSHQVEISLDGGPPVFATVIQFGETKEIDLDVTNVLRVRISTTSRITECCNYGEIALGNPRFT